MINFDLAISDLFWAVSLTIFVQGFVEIRTESSVILFD